MPKPQPPETIHLRTRYTNEEVRLVWCQYYNGRTALQLTTLDGEPILTATVNVPEVELADDEVCIKDYSENEGVFDSLIAARIIAPTTATAEGRHVSIPVCRWLVEVPGLGVANHEGDTVDPSGL